jgi:dTDP-4-amino-4,6-dideoxygalactose transaminase
MSQAPIVLAKIYETYRDLAIRRMIGLPEMIARQRRNADHYLQNLTVDADMLCRETPRTFFNRLQFPLLVPTPVQCDRLVKRLLQNQVSTARPYKDIAAIAAGHYGYRGDCPQAESIASRVLVIPCNYALKASEVERISTCVNRAWSEVAGRGRGAILSSAANSSLIRPQGANVTPVAERRHIS